MQPVSEALKKDIRNDRKLRNRAYIKAYVGIINQIAQSNARVDSELTYYSNPKSPFNTDIPTKIYATGEKDFSKVDGSRFFLPKKKAGVRLYNNGIVSADLLGSIRITFGNEKGLDIKGLTINFSEFYPTEFVIEYDEGERRYSNDKPTWTTEDVFSNVSFFNIRPIRMVNQYGRLRIFEFTCGLTKSFSNESVIKCNSKEYISPIAETVSSQDLTLEINNRDLYFDVDNENSAIAFMETGQEIQVSYGYEMDGNIEWITPRKCFLSTWKADDSVAEFHATDRFALMNENFYKGLYREQGINLYNLAKEVLSDAGMAESEYFIDPYLRGVIVYNPVPPVTHKEALQLIANAGRCVLYQGRDGKIYLKNNFVPTKTVTTNDIAEFSKIENVLKPGGKYAYAMGSKDFSKVDGSIYFLPKSPPYLMTGYVSASLADESGKFKINPKITISLEAAFTCFGIMINFRNTAPKIFEIRTYLKDIPVQDFKISNPTIDNVINYVFNEFDKMEIEILNGYPNARVTIDNILLGDYTDYHLSKNYMRNQANRDKEERISRLIINKTEFSKNNEEKELVNSDMVLKPEQGDYTAYFSNPCYGYRAEIEDNPAITCRVIESGDYYAKILFEGVTRETAVKLKVIGHEYTRYATKYSQTHNEYGRTVEWGNPLISNNEQAKKLEKWIATYLLGTVDYSINWWGDPTADAGDLFYFPTQKEEILIKSYENELTFDGSWKGKMKARRVVLND